MAEALLPPFGGVLGRPAGAPPLKWQRLLRELALPEGLAALAWSLAGVPEALSAAQRRELALVLLAVLVHEAQGSTCLPLQDAEALGRLARLLGEPRLPTEVLQLPQLESLLGTGPGRSALVLAEGLLSSRRLYDAEAALARHVTARAADAVGRPDLPAELRADPVQLSEEQGEAVALALSGGLALITGGPGTGKTSIIVAILRAALRLGCDPADLLLAAPTGKAAHRMAAAIREAHRRIGRPDPADAGLLDARLAPQTLHRLLGYVPDGDRFRHHAGNPLRTRLLVVDEASMIDVQLMGRLLEALPSGASLVLLGDADQLPSVAAGTAFRDLVAGLPGRTVRLTRSYRMAEGEGSGGPAILSTAAKINEGRAEALFAEPRPIAVRAEPADVQGLGVELLEADEAGLRRFLDGWLAREIQGAEGFLEGLQQVFHLGPSGWAEGEATRLQSLVAGMDRARLLCPVRQAPGLRGVEGLNAYLHERVQELREQGIQKRLAFSLGEPVMMTRNDYARGIFNGDQGLLLKVARPGGEPRLEAVFPVREGFQAFAVGPLLGDLELAYATTVHKAQGSEFDRVALVLPEADHPLATREVLYTALTRARRGALIVGSRALLGLAAGRGPQRHSRWASLTERAGTDGPQGFLNR